MKKFTNIIAAIVRNIVDVYRDAWLLLCPPGGATVAVPRAARGVRAGGGARARQQRARGGGGGDARLPAVRASLRRPALVRAPAAAARRKRGGAPPAPGGRRRRALPPARHRAARPQAAQVRLQGCCEVSVRRRVSDVLI